MRLENPLPYSRVKPPWCGLFRWKRGVGWGQPVLKRVHRVCHKSFQVCLASWLCLLVNCASKMHILQGTDQLVPHSCLWCEVFCLCSIFERLDRLCAVFFLNVDEPPLPEEVKVRRNKATALSNASLYIGPSNTSDCILDQCRRNRWFLPHWCYQSTDWQHTGVYVSIRTHTSAYVSIRQHT